MRAAKIDSNQNQIISALRDAGASITSLASVGMGFPDLAVGYGGLNFFLEVKGEKGQLTPFQKAFFDMWKGSIHVVRTPEEALHAIGATAADAAKEK